MNENVRGIVIRQIDYKDNDAIVTVYTSEYDRIGLYVKGYKKITSKNVYATQIFDESTFLFDYNPISRFQTLKSASLVNEHKGIKADYDRLAIASLICEIADSVYQEGGYADLKKALDLLDSSKEPYTVLNLYLALALKQAGLGVSVDGCSLCGSTEGIVALSVNDGGFVCSKCNSMLHLPACDPEYLRRQRIINKADFSVFDRIIGLGLNSFPITQDLMSFMKEYLDADFRSYRSLVSLNGGDPR
ncbi:MAG: DNA repair protein RecO [Erysipelotrichaceae bacterium]|nr:DNA repair protein RecO [Erysipelotrichaceae bacterium]